MSFFSAPGIRPWIGLLTLFSVAAAAEVHNIDATFEPDFANPQKNQFKNQTQSEGFCRQVPGACEPIGLFSLIARIPFAANAPIQANHADPRRGGMAKVPSNWSTVSVTNASGDTHIVEVRIAGIGHEAGFPLSVGELTGGGWWDDLWEGGAWVYAPPPCLGVGTVTAGHHGYNSFWRVPEGAGTCAKKALFDIPVGMNYQYFVYAYELRTPDPLKMDAGDYTGSITYTVGPNMDFDMGDVMIPSDSMLTLNFNLKVTHTMKVDIPPGGNRVVLEPLGGWQSWLNQGRKPTRLMRDQTFNISASSRFRMNIECEYVMGNNCALWESTAGHGVPLEVSVTLPNGLTDSAGQPVKRRRLWRDGSGTELFQPGFYLDRKVGTLHFEVARDAVDEMLKDGYARSYSGNVTVIWDSEVS
ncbi:hypothetical protein HUW52_07475 [Pseudomonas sp. 43A]|uniref:hypothetical protein n=1 Tax=unclassified Pseudomonas TaxID=196821 RepID=UPI001587C5D1|nr:MULTISPECIES: hypothetical protein [unclassified Pseudomonas]QKV62724.1 hypothetical protein HUW52_07475 [Pseudomonas sp. 43A]QMW09135.1 hypothetical protein H3303_25225 [Pseudomonas sp. 29A]